VPTYSVSQKIRTVATIDTTIEAEDGSTPEGPPSRITLPPFPRKADKAAQAWAADLTVDAEDRDAAVSDAWQRLIPLLDRLAVVTQSAFSIAAQSYLVCRLTDNQGGIFYMFGTRARHPVGMPLSSDEVADIKALAAAPANAANVNASGHQFFRRLYADR